MIEIIPFIHSMLTVIATKVGSDRPERIIATSMVAIAMSSIITGKFIDSI